MAEFEVHLPGLVEKEGGWRLIDVEHDRGGRTYAGISERANPEWRGWKLIDNGAGETRLREAVRERYLVSYWTPIMGDRIESDAVAEIMLSCCVLSGPANAVRMAQRAAGVAADGIMGPDTLAAVNAMPAREFCAVYALQRIARFAGIVNRDHSQAKFLRGWINRVVSEVGL